MKSLADIENEIDLIEHIDFHSASDRERLRILNLERAQLLSLNKPWDKTPPERELRDTSIPGQPELFEGAA